MARPAIQSEDENARFDFFISRIGADADWARWIAWQLEEADFSTLLQDWDLSAADFALSMDGAVARSGGSIVVLSPESLEAQFARPEGAAAFHEGPVGENPLLMVARVRPCQPEGLLASVHRVDLFGIDEAEARERLLSGARLLASSGGEESGRPQRSPGTPAASPPGQPRPRFPGARPAVWNVPHDRNGFSGRDSFLEGLRLGFAAGDRVIAIRGLDGSGKTIAAVEYAYRHWSDYDVVWWVRAAEPATLVADLASLAHDRGLVSKEHQNLPAAAERARTWLETSNRWLLVFDDAGGPDSVRDFLPGGIGGHVLITSSTPLWGTVARVRGLERWEPEEAIGFLLERSGRRDREAAGRIAGLLEYLPLALEQAGAYVQGTGCTLAEYAALAETRSARSPQSAARFDYPAAVATTLDLSLAVIEARSLGAGDLLRLCAFFAPEAIPLSMIHAAPHLPEPLRSAVADALDLDRTVRILRRYSLVTRSNGGIAVHPLVQLVARRRMDQAEERKLAVAAVAIVDAAFPSSAEDPVTWRRSEPLVPHALTAARWVRTAGAEPWRTARLLDHVGRHLRSSARYQEARAALQEALRRAEEAHGPDDPAVAAIATDLAAVLRDLGHLESARDLVERAVRIDEAWYGPDDLRVARKVSRLAVVLADLGDLEHSRRAFRRALQIHETVYGKEHPTVGVVCGNFGMLLRRLGDLQGAKDACERALRIHETAYGRGHPIVARDSANLASVLLALGDLAGAKEGYERALHIDEAVYGEEHPEVASDLLNLAVVFRALGDTSSVEEVLRRGLAVSTAVFGANHPRTKAVLDDLASTRG